MFGQVEDVGWFDDIWGDYFGGGVGGFVQVQVFGFEVGIGVVVVGFYIQFGEDVWQVGEVV